MINATNYRGPIPTANKLPSCTVPDMTLSLRDLINRHKAGGRVTVYDPLYVRDSNILPPDFEKMDRIQRQELARSLSDFVETTRGRIITQRKAREFEAHKANVIAEYEANKSKSVVDDVKKADSANEKG